MVSASFLASSAILAINFFDDVISLAESICFKIKPTTTPATIATTITSANKLALNIELYLLFAPLENPSLRPDNFITIFTVKFISIRAIFKPPGKYPIF
jgi:hypothetical protein